MKFTYEATHFSTGDGSPAMMLAEWENLIVLVNEDGFAWSDEVDRWEPIDAEPHGMDEGYYLSGSGELSNDDSYIDYLNRN